MPHDLIAGPNEEAWMGVHRRVFEVPGDVVDLGCVRWDWSSRFFGKKRVIGVDPFATLPGQRNVELFQGVVTPVRGLVRISGDGIHSSVRASDTSVAVESITFADLLERYKVERVSVLKINTEGSEYELLITMLPALLQRIDQIAVSFHDFKDYCATEQTDAVAAYLSNWYDVRLLQEQWRWFLFTRR